MTGVDTNVIVRLLTGDDPVQAEKSRNVFRKPEIYIPETVILETEWVLRHAYHFGAETIGEAFKKLCGLPNVVLHNPRSMQAALQWYSDGMDFADALHLAASQGCKTFLSFDRRFVRKSDGLGRCRVKEP
jgi:predicted nucleic-acid-binding protein